MQEVNDYNTTGHNFGKYSLEKEALLFSNLDLRPVFQVPYNQISISNASGKNEVAVEFAQPERKDGQRQKGDMLSEIRFYVQNSEIENRQISEQDDEEELTAAKCFNDRLVKKAGLGDQQGDIIATFEELPMLIPRGKYTMDMYEEFAKFHGRTHDYKIMYSDIKKVFQLPRADTMQMSIVIQLSKPLKQGQTLHHFIMIQIEKDIVVTKKLNLTPEQIKAKYDDNLEQELQGPLYHILATLFKNIVDVDRIIIPGDFRSIKDSASSAMPLQHVKCSIKANEGFLYPLKSSLLFLHKPVLYIKHSSIKYVELFRLKGASSKSFDMGVRIFGEQEQLFTSIEMGELKGVINYFKGVNVKVREGDVENNEMGNEISDDEVDRPRKRIQRDEDEGEEDEDYDQEDEDGDFDEKEVNKIQKQEESGTDEEEQGESDMSGDVDAGVDDDELNHLKTNKKMDKKKRKK